MNKHLIWENFKTQYNGDLKKFKTFFELNFNEYSYYLYVTEHKLPKYQIDNLNPIAIKHHALLKLKDIAITNNYTEINDYLNQI